ncbi:MAG: peptidylprolyl isomerase [Candidatus Lokiarchaeota archaeon]|nr:peptidylprolyl isomerase [Candidatus Harpocratesius repetitus]
MPIENGDTVKVEYKGFFDDGEVFDSTERNGGKPLEFTVGSHQVIPGFENSVIGKEINQEFEIRLEPKEAYGEYHPEAVQVVSAKEFPPEIEPKVGMMLQVQQKHEDHEHTIPVWIKKVENEEVTLDFNHPMAGKTLNFKITVKEIARP